MFSKSGTPRGPQGEMLLYLIVAAFLCLALVIGTLPEGDPGAVTVSKAPQTQETLPPRTVAPTDAPSPTPTVPPVTPSPTALPIVPALPTDEPTPTPATGATPAVLSYVINTNTRRFHLPSCSSVGAMKEKNRRDFTGDRQELIDQGYKPCGNCHP